MVRDLQYDTNFLKIPSIPATPEDLSIAEDLRDTLEFHKEQCVGMAANMIGYSKRIIAFFHDTEIQVMFNPEIIDVKRPFMTSEGCLCLNGQKSVQRYREVTVTWQDSDFQTQSRHYRGFTAQIIQHEIDHFSGILI